MTISHPPVDAASDEAFVFAELAGFTCSICAPVSWDVGRVIGFAEEKFPSSAARWVSVDTADLLGLKTHTPNPCNGAPELRKHWFMMRGEIVTPSCGCVFCDMGLLPNSAGMHHTEKGSVVCGKVKP